MVYRERSVHLLFLLVIFCIYILSYFHKNGQLLIYVLNLNYWSTNTIFVIVLVTNFLSRLHIFFLIPATALSFKLTALTSFLVEKKLLSALVVGTIVIHPLAFYLFTIIFFVKFLKKGSKYLTSTLTISLRHLVLYLFFTLILGGFWGLQSISWGYFWVNDTIEWLLLFKILYLLFILHVLDHSRNSFNEFFLPSLILSFILFVRLNILQTRHNFISSQTLVYFIIVFYLIIFTVVSKNHTRIKRCIVRTNTILTLVCLGIVSTFFLTWAVFSKYLWTIIFILYMWTNKPSFLTKHILMHFLSINFFNLWLLHFNFFYLHYFYKMSVGLDLLSVFEKLFTLVNHYGTAQSFVFLEGVTFYSLSNVYSTVALLHNLSLHIFLNNHTLIYPLFFFFLVKRVEFRFLYKKRTLI